MRGTITQLRDRSAPPLLSPSGGLFSDFVTASRVAITKPTKQSQFAHFVIGTRDEIAFFANVVHSVHFSIPKEVRTTKPAKLTQPC